MVVPINQVDIKFRQYFLNLKGEGDFNYFSHKTLIIKYYFVNLLQAHAIGNKRR